MDIVIAVVFGQVHEHTCSTAALSGTAETAVTDAPARGAKPLLEEHNNISFRKVLADVGCVSRTTTQLAD